MAFSYSGDEFYRDWRYKITHDFQTDSGEPFKYVVGGHLGWGSGDRKVTLPTTPCEAAISSDGSLFAIASGHDIHVLDVEDFKVQQVLKGHISRVDAIAFQPGNSNILVSAATNNHAGSVRADCDLIIWDLQAQKDQPEFHGEAISKIARDASDVIVTGLERAKKSIVVAEEQANTLSKDIEDLISKLVAQHSVAGGDRISGRLLMNFGTENFNPSGDKLMYLPGNRPRSNSIVPWDMHVLSMETREDLFSLVGHTDALMWSGFSHDERMIGTCSWDKTMRIWDSETGDLKYRFDTMQQNWTGGFSPDSKLFAGTCGDGTVYVYSMLDGSTLFSRQMDIDWCRHLAWSPNSKMLAIGGRRAGGVFVIDVERNEIVQRRELSLEACKVDDERKRRLLKGYLEVSDLQYADSGRKLIVLTGGDGGIEVYDLHKQYKWRFARPGTDEDIEGETTADVLRGKGVFRITVWEDHGKQTIMIAGLVDDGVRIWSIPKDNTSA